MQPSGSRAEVDLPVRLPVHLPFATPLDIPGGLVAMADAKLRVLCRGGSAMATALKPRLADASWVQQKHRKAAAAATQTPVVQRLSEAAVGASLCQR